MWFHFANLNIFVTASSTYLSYHDGDTDTLHFFGLNTRIPYLRIYTVQEQVVSHITPLRFRGEHHNVQIYHRILNQFLQLQDVSYCVRWGGGLLRSYLYSYLWLYFMEKKFWRNCLLSQMMRQSEFNRLKVTADMLKNKVYSVFPVGDKGAV